MNKRAAALIMVLSAISMGCSSLRMRADKHFEAGEFNSAATLYEQIVERDPRDTEAPERLRISRQNVLDASLIEVRQLRLSNNHGEALAKLREIVVKETQWELAPSGPAFSTQTEETTELFKWFKNRIQSDLKEGHFLRAKLYAEDNSPVFATVTFQKSLSEIQRQVQLAGEEHCQSLNSSTKGAFANDFVGKYCLVWGRAFANSDLHPEIESFGSIQLEGEIKDLPTELLPMLSDNLLAALKNTPYYRPLAGPLRVTLSGTFVGQYSERPIVQIHHYKVLVPYLEAKEVEYTEFVSYIASELVKNAVTGQMESRSSMKTMDVPRTRTEYVTRYHYEDRVHPYEATSYELKYALDANALLQLDGVGHTIPVSENFESKGVFHNESNKSIDLKPKPKVVPAQSDWLKDRFATMGTSLNERVLAAWEQKYCQSINGASSADQLNAVMRCVRGSPSQHEFVDNWFQAKFGLSFAQVKSTVGI